MLEQLTRAEAFGILEDCCHLVSSDDFMEERAIDIVTLHRLSLFTPTEHIACRFQDIVKQADARCILKVAERETVWNTLRLVNII